VTVDRVPYRLRDVARNIGLRVRELRRAKAWTQEDLAEKMGKTAQWISLIENGQPISVETLTRLANVFSADFASFFTVVSARTPAAPKLAKTKTRAKR
jgi:transcriptional regulator with XRE-family HTH domain